jgi:aminoglycoside phosphotransferase (APT) family kinase protein
MAEEIRQALGCGLMWFRRIDGGSHRRTYLVHATAATAGAPAWVARFAAAPATELQRRVTAQRLARAAGVRAPAVVGHNLARVGLLDGGAVQPGHAEEWCWVVERFVPGRPFDPSRMDATEAQRTAVDLGQQFRALHGVRLDAYGHVPPRQWAVYATYREQMAHTRMGGESGAETALRLAGHPAPAAVLPAIRDVYRFLLETYREDGARLLKSDCNPGNFLVRGGRVTALLDWEWATGGDPAAEVSEWLFMSADKAGERASELLDALLDGYEPHEPGRFRRRVLAYQVAHALAQMQDFHEHRHRMRRDALGRTFASLCSRLEHHLATRAWESPMG